MSNIIISKFRNSVFIHNIKILGISDFFTVIYLYNVSTLNIAPLYTTYATIYILVFVRNYSCSHTLYISYAADSNLQNVLLFHCRQH